MGAFQRKYTDDQLAAIIHAGMDSAPRVAAKDIVRMAREGVLTAPNGVQLEPFDLSLSTVRTYLQRERRRRRDAIPKRAEDMSDPAIRKAAAIREAWAIVDKDLKHVGRAKIYDEHGKIIGENIGKKHRALGEIMKNVAALERLAEGPPTSSATPAETAAAKVAEAPSGMAELERKARTEPAQLAEARPATTVADRLQGRGPLPPVAALRAE